MSEGEIIARVARIYDFAMTHKLDSDDWFIHRIQYHCAEARLNFFLVEPLWVEQFYDAYEEGTVWARVLLNMHSEHHQPQEIFHRLVRLAAERGTRVIDPPHVAVNAFDKAWLHPRLAMAGINVPPTLVVPGEAAGAFKLSEADRTFLGEPFVIKPGMGYGRRGVVLDARNESDLARSVAAWPDANYLLQRRIVPRLVNDAPAYFRVYYVFDAVWCCWWNCFTDQYRVVLPEEVNRFELEPLEKMIRSIAALTGMSFFSSEIAQTETGEFIVIDYVNDQCHMLSQSSSPHMGVPDELVAAIAGRLVQSARNWIDS